MNTQLRKLILGFCFTLFCISLNAQNYEYIPIVKPGVQIWSDDFSYFTPVGVIYRFYRYALTEEDTIIENETYKKLYLFSNSEFNPLTAQCIGGIRENEQRQVFYKGAGIGYTTQSGLICDFSLSVGDTFSISDFSGSPCSVQVKTIDTINYGGALRRVFNVRTEGEPSFNIATWIEGMGNVEGLLYDMDSKIMMLDYLGRNRCYEHNDILLYYDYPQGVEDCFTPVLSINSIKAEDNSITLYPNPAKSDIKISSESRINSIEVFNSLGQKIYQEKINAKEKMFDINSFSKGIYIIGVSTDKGYINKKLIKN